MAIKKTAYISMHSEPLKKLKSQAWRHDVRRLLSYRYGQPLDFWELNKVIEKELRDSGNLLARAGYEVRLDQPNRLWSKPGTRRQLTDFFDVSEETEHTYQHGPEGSFLWDAIEMGEHKNLGLLHYAAILGQPLERLMRAQLSQGQLRCVLSKFPKHAFATLAFEINRLQIERLQTANDAFLFGNFQMLLENQVIKAKLQRYGIEEELLTECLGFRGGTYIQNNDEESLTEHVETNMANSGMKIPLGTWLSWQTESPTCEALISLKPPLKPQENPAKVLMSYRYRRVVDHL